MADFKIAYAPLKRYEGGYSNRAGDAGGETYAGISRRFFPDWEGWKVVDAAKRDPDLQRKAVQTALNRRLSENAELTALVEDFYRTEWWDKLGLADLPQSLADEIFEQSVNLGKAGAGRSVQRLCNAFNWRVSGSSGARLFPDLKEDGALGPCTLNALKTLLQRTNAGALVHALNALQAYHYIRLAADNLSQRQFLCGWLTRTYDPQKGE